MDEADIFRMSPSLAFRARSSAGSTARPVRRFCWTPMRWAWALNVRWWVAKAWTIAVRAMLAISRATMSSTSVNPMRCVRGLRGFMGSTFLPRMAIEMGREAAPLVLLQQPEAHRFAHPPFRWIVGQGERDEVADAHRPDVPPLSGLGVPGLVEVLVLRQQVLQQRDRPPRRLRVGERIRR